MRIPTSVMVMACVTAIPFGLAIRSTVIERRQAREAVELVNRLEREREHERLEQERLEAQLAAAETAKREAVLASLFGADRATLGAAFGFALDDRASAATLAAAETALHDFAPRFDRGKDDRVIGMQLEIAGGCDTLRGKIEATWGKSDAHGDANDDYSVWLDPAHHHRASITSPDCFLRFNDYLEVADWVGVVPTDLVTKPIDAAFELLGPAQEMADDTLVWNLPGTGSGFQTTTYTLQVVDGVIRQIRLTVDVMSDEVPTLIDALSSRFKVKPTVDSSTGSDEWTWKRTPPTGAGFGFVPGPTVRFELQIGRSE